MESAPGRRGASGNRGTATQRQREIDRAGQRLALRRDLLDLGREQRAPHVEQLEEGDLALLLLQLGQVRGATQRAHLGCPCRLDAAEARLSLQAVEHFPERALHGP